MIIRGNADVSLVYRRSRDGGLRVGEMERDTIIAHGMAKYLKEKLMDVSDPYSVFVCDICGLFATRMIRNENTNQSAESDVYFCPACSNKTNITKVNIPYAFKLVIQEMLAMNIAARIRFDSNKY